MKKLLITLSAVAVTMLAFTATSDAGHNVRYLAGHDSCGRPIYSYRYVPSTPYCPPSHGSYGHAGSRRYAPPPPPPRRPSSYSGYSRGYSGRSYCR